MNELSELMRENVADPPPDHLDVATVLSGGRRRVRARRTAALGGTAVLVAGALVGATLAWPHGPEGAAPAKGVPTPDAPTIALADAQPAAEGRDYEVLASHTNQDLDSDNGQYFDGVTDDGLVLFRDGPRADQLYPRFALMDPATGEKDWLPDLAVGQTQTWPVLLGSDRLVLVSAEGGESALTAHVFDRATRQWSAMRWPSLPKIDFPRAVAGPDDRLYVPVLAQRGKPPEGGWPMGSDGEADDAGAAGDTYHLWSVSLTDATDVRDEGLDVGDVAFTDTSMVWTDRTNGDAGLVHVRDLATGAEHSFDPQAGERCNLLSFGAADDRVVLGEYCGTYDDGVRDDRVQILGLDGDQVVTLQDNGLDGEVSGPGASGDLVRVVSYAGKQAGTYVYDLATDRFLRVSDDVASWGAGGSAPGDLLLWNTPVNSRHGETEVLGRLLR